MSKGSKISRRYGVKFKIEIVSWPCKISLGVLDIFYLQRSTVELTIPNALSVQLIARNDNKNATKKHMHATGETGKRFKPNLT